VRNDSNESRQRSREKWEEIQDAFFSTLRSYARLAEFSVVAAVVNDSDQPPNYCLAPGSVSVDFKADCERITETILQGDEPSQRTWFRLLAGESVPPALARDVVLRCGTAYLEAGLHTYFRPQIKRRRGERVTE
jgi:hypothetical protein